MADLEFKVAKRRAKPITFSLGDDHDYTFTPPKNAVMMMPVLDADEVTDIGMTKATFDWLGQGMSDEDNERLLARLRDPKDDLDIDTLAEIVQSLSEKATGRPPT